MDRPIDVLSVGLFCADVPVLLPCDEVDFSLDSICVRELQVVNGGDAANAAVTLARLGVRSALGSIVGDDAFGYGILRMVEKSGVNTDYVRVVPGLSTSVSVVLVKESGDRLFLFSNSSTEAIKIDDITLHAFTKAKYINYGSLFGMSNLDRDADKLLRLAQEAGCITSLDVTGEPELIKAENAEKALRYVDYFIPSYREAKLLSGESSPRRMADFFIRETGDKCVIIKLGEEGCFIKTAERSFFVPAYKTEVADGTGAGDSFVGGFLAGLTYGWDIERSARFANGAAGFNTQFPGATTEFMCKERVLEFMEQSPRLPATGH